MSNPQKGRSHVKVMVTEAELFELQNQLALAKKVNAGHENNMETLAARVEELQSELSKLNTSLSKMTQCADALEEENAEWEKRNKRLSDRVRNREKQIEVDRLEAEHSRDMAAAKLGQDWLEQFRFSWEKK